FLNDGGGNFVKSPQPALQGFGNHVEAVDAVWFDADGDQDLDLYVVSGSVEYDPGHIFYRDRLYINQAGLLEEAPEGSLPDLRDSGGCVAVSDYDQDGDLDVFVGSRSLVGRYPLSPESRLLRNDGGLKFTEVAGAIGKCGLVTDAAWADIDSDGDEDLCLSTEWGPVRIFSNADGKFTEITEERGLAGDLGWWNCIEPVDVDGDGDLDLLVGNVGWNTKYGKSAELYYGDMDGGGEERIVEAKHSGESLLPVRGKSCSSHAMPSLAKRFASYRQFAEKDLFGIYSEQRLGGAEKFTAGQFASGVWINEGAGKPYRWLALPDAAQFSQVNAITSGDFDGDGRLEAVLAQNHDTREPETGLWRGGIGCHLEWNGSRFEVIPPAESGLVMPADTKSVIRLGERTIVAGQNNGGLLLFQMR
ncbi:MAG: FG-GAP repeat domain-containing protein, partial [Verrucomicrobiales bacterium]